MKRIIIIILFLLVSISVNATKYYVATVVGGGDDGHPGTIGEPWLTWNYAFNNTTSSDTCYFRGGVYTEMYSATLGANMNTVSVSGTHGNPTCFFAYPADWATGNYPILDCQSLYHATAGIDGIRVSRVSHIYFKGLHLRNVPLYATEGAQTNGWYLWSESSSTQYSPNDIKFEYCVTHNVDGAAFTKGVCDTTYFINCDAYMNCDTTMAYDPGGHGSGFQISGSKTSHINNDKAFVYLKDCRSWKNSDQGFVFTSAGRVVAENCWSINNGNFLIGQAKGSGYKIWIPTASRQNSNVIQVEMYNCLAIDNCMWGWNWCDLNDPTGILELRAHIYNNFAYRNGKLRLSGYKQGYGFADDNTVDTIGLWDHKYWNNLSYDNWGYTSNAYKTCPGDNTDGIIHQWTNKWDVSGTSVTNADFISLDTTGLCGARQTDGSLPVTFFGHLASTSELINTGTDVGLPYNGIAPDIGWVEYEPQDPPVDPIVIVIINVSAGARQATIGCTVTDDGGGTVSDRGVCWSESADPDLSDNHNHNGTGTGAFNSYITGLLPNTTYHVRAFATNEAGTGYSADSEFMTTSDAGLGGDVVFSPDGKPLFIYDNVSGTWKILVK